MNIYIVLACEFDSSTPDAAFAIQADAEAFAAAKNLDAAWASNDPDWGGSMLHYRVMCSTVPFHPALVESMSRGVDIAPLPDHPSELNLPHMPPADFVQLVRDGKIRVDTPDGDTAHVHIARVEGPVTFIGWDYEGPVDGEYVDLYGGLAVRPDTQPMRNGDTITIGLETFTITYA